jgi:hypothetical protein
VLEKAQTGPSTPLLAQNFSTPLILTLLHKQKKRKEKNSTTTIKENKRDIIVKEVTQ